MDSIPIIVELDAVLVRSKGVWGDIVRLLQHRARDKAATNRESFSYRYDVVSYLIDQQSRGHRLLLGTYGDFQEAAAVAACLGIFDGVVQLASDPGTVVRASDITLKDRSFDFVGSRHADSAMWDKARSVIIAGDGRLEGDLKSRGVQIKQSLANSKPSPKAWVSALRVHQWSKNLLILLPLVASHQLLEWGKVKSALIAFVAFSLCVSATYIWNDIADLETDRLHPAKRKRAFVSGQIPVATGIFTSLALLAAGLAISSTMLPNTATVTILIYIAATLLYSTYLKRKLAIDVVMLTLLFSLRVFIGGIVTEVEISPWLFAFSTFFFLSLAFVKRFVDLARIPPGETQRLGGRGYIAQDIGLVSSMGSSSGLISVLILALYITSPGVVELYSKPEILWLLCPALLYWVARVWFLAHRGEMTDDPVSFALTDKVSLWVALLMLICVAAASRL